MSRSVQRLGPIEIIGDLDWPSFLSESTRSYAKAHRATHWMQIGENQGFYSPDQSDLTEKPFMGALYSVAALVYDFFSKIAEKSDRNIRELDLLVLLPCATPDEISWVRLDDGVITQDEVLTGIDALEKIRHLPAYVSIYSALDIDLPHSNIKQFSWKILLRDISNQTRIRAARFQFKNVSKQARVFLAAVSLGLIGIIWGGYALFNSFKPKAAPIVVVDHTDAYMDKLLAQQKASGDKKFAIWMWTEMMRLPVVEDGWSRQRVVCRVAQCNHDWKLMAGSVQSLEQKYKVASFSGDAAKTEVPNTVIFEHAPIEAVEAQSLDKQLSLVRESLSKTENKLVIDIASPTQVNFPGLTHVKRLANLRTFTIKVTASSFPEIIKALPDNVVIDQIDVTIETDPKLVIEGKVYVL